MRRDTYRTRTYSAAADELRLARRRESQDSRPTFPVVVAR